MKTQNRLKGRSISFQKHYNIPPPRCQGPIYYFRHFALFSLFRAVARKYTLRFYAVILAYLCRICPFLLYFGRFVSLAAFCAGKGVGFSTNPKFISPAGVHHFSPLRHSPLALPVTPPPHAWEAIRNGFKINRPYLYPKHMG